MTGAELIAECRRRLRDTEAPQLWTDEDIIGYLAKAEEIMAEQAHVLHDYTTYTVTTADGVSTYALSPDVLSVIVAQESTSTTPLRRLTAPYRTLYTSATSPPSKYAVVGVQPPNFILTPAADGIYTIYLAAAIRPTTALVAEADPEIPATYHRALVDYAVSQCQSHADTEGFAPEQAQLAEAAWLQALREAKREVYRVQYSANVIAGSPSWTGK